MGELTHAAQAAEQATEDTTAAAERAAAAAEAAAQHAEAAAVSAIAAATEPVAEPAEERWPAHDHPHEHDGYAPSADVAALSERLAALEGQVSAHLAEAAKPTEAEVTPVEPPKPEPEKAPEPSSKKRRLFGGLG